MHQKIAMKKAAPCKCMLLYSSQIALSPVTICCCMRMLLMYESLIYSPAVSLDIMHFSPD